MARRGVMKRRRARLSSALALGLKAPISGKYASPFAHLGKLLKLRSLDRRRRRHSPACRGRNGRATLYRCNPHGTGRACAGSAPPAGRRCRSRREAAIESLMTRMVVDASYLDLIYFVTGTRRNGAGPSPITPFELGSGVSTTAIPGAGLLSADRISDPLLIAQIAAWVRF
jgi:hypothetical protein